MKVKRSFLEYWKGALAYGILAKREKEGKRNFVPRYISNKRAEICLKCPFNKPVGRLEKISDELILSKVGGRTTSHDSQLLNCDACSCPLKLAVHLNADVLRETKDSTELFARIRKREKATGKTIHPECWQIKIFQNK